jgi:hypothetical protein
MSEVVFALLRGEDVESIAKRRLDILLSHDLFVIANSERRKIDIVEVRRRARMPFVIQLKMFVRGGVKEHIVAKILFVYDFLGRSLQKLNRQYIGSLYEQLLKWITSANGIDYSTAILTPLSYSILYNLDPFTLTQMVIAVDGLAGVGKTSLVYNSIKAVLLALGLSEKEAQELFLAMYLQRMDDFVVLMKIAREKNVRLPIIVFDDAAATASAYLWFTESRKKMIEFARAMTITREKVANLVLVGPYSSIFKGLRRLAHMVFEPSTHYDLLSGGRRLVTSLWYVYMQNRIIDLTGTITPHPMKVDDTVYTLITEVKKKIWEEITERAEAETIAEGGEEEWNHRSAPGALY